MGPQAIQPRVLLDKRRARGIKTKKTIEMHRGHARIADDHTGLLTGGTTMSREPVTVHRFEHMQRSAPILIDAIE